MWGQLHSGGLGFVTSLLVGELGRSGVESRGYRGNLLKSESRPSFSVFLDKERWAHV